MLMRTLNNDYFKEEVTSPGLSVLNFPTNEENSFKKRIVFSYCPFGGDRR